MKDVCTHTMVWKMEEMKAAVHIVDSCIMTVYVVPWVNETWLD